MCWNRYRPYPAREVSDHVYDELKKILILAGAFFFITIVCVMSKLQVRPADIWHLRLVSPADIQHLRARLTCGYTAGSTDSVVAVPQEWYLDRQSFFESAVLDAVPKIKASMLAEDWDDVIVRANAELTRLIHLVTVLDRHPLVSDARPLLVKNTLLTGKRCHRDKVLCKAISGVLQSQGFCVIIGSDTLYVSRLLHTLALFVPDELRWCCLRMYRHKFSPYVRLQVVHRYELPYVMQCGALSSWPICVVDVDRATVCMSPPYSRHRVLKQRADVQRIGIVLDSSERCKPVTL
ncbi:unnamed protein product [Heligmosomoides polygyrus]|uniref:GPI transamidase component PIG-S n=1 Tax=Heligmosomoides polygyrus TaxID=6339 RepID=A0A183G1F5_HELPZ|nr:unnamed protein product [Heligmosomoides polygyrus]